MRSGWRSLTSSTDRRSVGSSPSDSARLTRAATSFGKQLPPNPAPAARKWGETGGPSDALHDLVDVDPEAFADVPDLIRERYLGREEGV